MTANFHSTRLMLVIASGVLLGGCATETLTQGITINEEQMAAIEIGITDRNEVLRHLGPPSIASLDGERAWYYISWKTRRREPFVPRELTRDIVAVYFSNSGQVERLDTLDKKDGMSIAYTDVSTTAPGVEPGWLSLIFGNIGRIIPAGLPTE